MILGYFVHFVYLLIFFFSPSTFSPNCSLHMIYNTTLSYDQKCQMKISTAQNVRSDRKRVRIQGNSFHVL